MKTVARFGAICAVAVALVGSLYAILFRTPADRHALVVSGVLAVVVQVAGFAVLRSVDRSRLLGMWGLAAGLRLLTLVVYGLVFVRPLGLPPVAALLSLATYLFVTTLVESTLIAK